MGEYRDITDATTEPITVERGTTREDEVRGDATDKEEALQARINLMCERLTALERALSGRVPAGELRRPDLPGIRQPSDDLGEELPG